MRDNDAGITLSPSQSAMVWAMQDRFQTVQSELQALQSGWVEMLSAIMPDGVGLEDLSPPMRVGNLAVFYLRPAEVPVSVTTDTQVEDE